MVSLQALNKMGLNIIKSYASGQNIITWRDQEEIAFLLWIALINTMCVDGVFSDKQLRAAAANRLHGPKGLCLQWAMVSWWLVLWGLEGGSEKWRNFIFWLWETSGIRSEAGLPRRVVWRRWKCLQGGTCCSAQALSHCWGAAVSGMLLSWLCFQFGLLWRPADRFVLKTWLLLCCNATSLSSTSRLRMQKWFQRKIFHQCIACPISLEIPVKDLLHRYVLEGAPMGKMKYHWVQQAKFCLEALSPPQPSSQVVVALSRSLPGGSNPYCSPGTRWAKGRFKGQRMTSSSPGAKGEG